jgi:hypothetical protein
MSKEKGEDNALNQHEIVRSTIFCPCFEYFKGSPFGGVMDCQGQVEMTEDDIVLQLSKNLVSISLHNAVQFTLIDWEEIYTQHLRP